MAAIRTRRIIDDAGYGDHFGHALGHGVGLEVHEGPRLAQRSDDVLAPGTVPDLPGSVTEVLGR